MKKRKSNAAMPLLRKPKKINRKLILELAHQVHDDLLEAFETSERLNKMFHRAVLRINTLRDHLEGPQRRHTVRCRQRWNS